MLLLSHTRTVYCWCHLLSGEFGHTGDHKCQLPNAWKVAPNLQTFVLQLWLFILGTGPEWAAVGECQLGRTRHTEVAWVRHAYATPDAELVLSCFSLVDAVLHAAASPHRCCIAWACPLSYC